MLSWICILGGWVRVVVQRTKLVLMAPPGEYPLAEGGVERGDTPGRTEWSYSTMVVFFSKEDPRGLETIICGCMFTVDIRVEVSFIQDGPRERGRGWTIVDPGKGAIMGEATIDAAPKVFMGSIGTSEWLRGIGMPGAMLDNMCGGVSEIMMGLASVGFSIGI